MGSFTAGISGFGLGNLMTEPDLVKREVAILFGGSGQDSIDLSPASVGSGTSSDGNPVGFNPGPSSVVDTVEIRSWITTQSANSSADGQVNTAFGNYSLQFDKSTSGITITDNLTRDTTTITGDPHVAENGQTFTFKGNTTFQLGDGTDITVKTVAAGNGQTLSDEVDLSHGAQSVTVTGLAANDSNPLTISKGINGWQMRSANSSDPTIYQVNGQWDTSGGTAVDQLYADLNL